MAEDTQDSAVYIGYRDYNHLIVTWINYCGLISNNTLLSSIDLPPLMSSC